MNEVLKSLTIKSFHIEDVIFDYSTKINNGVLAIPKMSDEYLNGIVECKLNIIKPKSRDIFVNSILDIVPISTKVYGVLGTGVTHTLTGVYVIICAKFKSGEQVKNFGCATGILQDIVVLNKAGTYGDDDILIHFDIVLDDFYNANDSIYNAHLFVDNYIQNIRDEMKQLDGSKSTETHIFKEQFRKDTTKIAIIKQVSGQGAMENNLIFPSEPSGMEGGKTIMEMQNTPIVVSPNEYRDGAIRALT